MYYRVIENFLEEKDLNLIKDTIGGDVPFPWYNQKRVTDGVNALEDFYFINLLFINFRPTSDYYNIVVPIIKKLDAKALIRVKANLYTKTKKRHYHSNHKDFTYPHKAAIFYVNTNDGYTVLDDKIKIKSVENRLLLFDPQTIHRSSTCTDQKFRININFNYF
jgi:hypothetical protein